MGLVVVVVAGGGGHSGGGVSTEEVLVLAVFVAAVWPPNPLEAEPGAAVVALALAVPVLVAFARPRI